MIRKFFQFLSAVVVISSCSHRQEQFATSISGMLQGCAGMMIYLEELDVSSRNVLDSARISSEGRFGFKVPADDAGFYILRTTPENMLLLAVEPGENVEISINDSVFGTRTEIINSPGSVKLKDFESFMIHQKARVDSLADIYYKSQDSLNFFDKKTELDSAYKIIYEDQRRYVMDLINKYPGSLTSLIVLNRKLGMNTVLDEEDDFVYFHRIDSALMITHQNNKHSLDHHKRVEEIRGRIFDRFTAEEKLKSGEKAPNIVVHDTTGKLIALRSLAGEKVLIYFWAGWNAKARQDNRKLVPFYPELRKRNIELFGVSLDENRVVWLGALKLDKLPGIQGSDLKGLNSEAVKDYNLARDILWYYLIDEDQKILYRSKDFDEVVARIIDLK
jgi:hypothetical protein